MQHFKTIGQLKWMLWTNQFSVWIEFRRDIQCGDSPKVSIWMTSIFGFSVDASIEQSNKSNKAFREPYKHPHPLDQWTNSPFMGQQFRNCKNFTLTQIIWQIYLPCTVAQEQAHCASNVVSTLHIFHSKSINLPIPKIWLLKFDLEKSKVKVMGEVKVLKSQLGSNILSTHMLLVPCQSTL